MPGFELNPPRPKPVKLISGEGLVARFSPIKGITPTSALDQKIYLPAILNTFTVSETALHNEYDTISGGHFSQPAQGGASARQFRTMSLDTITVDFDTRWQVAHGQNADGLRTRIYEILRSKQPVRLQINFYPAQKRPSEFDGYVTLREVDKDVRPGENESRYLTLSISEWRDPSTGRRASNGSAGRKPGVSLPTTKALTADDTLLSLSYEFYGTYANWRDIASVNGILNKWGQSTPLVDLSGRWAVGYKIKIPKVSKSVPTPITAPSSSGVGPRVGGTS